MLKKAEFLQGKKVTSVKHRKHIKHTKFRIKVAYKNQINYTKTKFEQGKSYRRKRDNGNGKQRICNSLAILLILHKTSVHAAHSTWWDSPVYFR